MGLRVFPKSQAHFSPGDFLLSTNIKLCQSSAEFDWYVFSVLYHLNECGAWIRNQGWAGTNVTLVPFIHPFKEY